MNSLKDQMTDYLIASISELNKQFSIVRTDKMWPELKGRFIVRLTFHATKCVN